MNNVLEVTAETFKSEVLDAELPVLAEFFSPWCGSCRKMDPIMDRLAGKFAGRIKFARINVDSDPDLAGRHNIVAVPTLILFEDGRPSREVVGMTSQGWLEAVLEKVSPSAQETEALVAG